MKRQGFVWTMKLWFTVAFRSLISGVINSTCSKYFSYERSCDNGYPFASWNEDLKLPSCVYVLHTKTHAPFFVLRKEYKRIKILRRCNILKYSKYKYYASSNIWVSHSNGYDITPYSPLKFNRSFGGIYRLRLQEQNEDGGYMFLRNVSKHPADYKAL
jgi:hypothetical protein